jgi:hypothetical protein
LGSGVGAPFAAHPQGRVLGTGDMINSAISSGTFGENYSSVNMKCQPKVVTEMVLPLLAYNLIRVMNVVGI